MIRRLDKQVDAIQLQLVTIRDLALESCWRPSSPTAGVLADGGWPDRGISRGGGAATPKAGDTLPEA
jgi:hypothetical protein